MRYAYPTETDSLIQLRQRYGNFINNAFVPPVQGNYFTNTSPVNGSVIGEFPRSDKEDVERALDAAHAAAESWGKTSVQQRSLLLLKIADRLEENLERLAVNETWDNGKPGARNAGRRSAAGGGSFPLFRWLFACAGGQRSGDRRIYRGLPFS